MRSLAVILVFSFLIVAGLSSSTRADVNAGVSITDQGVRSFYLAIGNFYRVPEQEVVVVHQREIPDDELPVVFFIARRARVEPEVIVQLRREGESWMDITLHYNLSPDIYYVPVEGNPGPPYGHAYGYFKNRPRSEWREIRLADDDIVNLVNLRFMSDHYGYSPTQVIQMRARGDNFVSINRNIYQEKHPSRDQGDNQKGGKGKSHDKGEGKQGNDRGHGGGHGDKED